MIFLGTYLISPLSAYTAEIKLAWDHNKNSNIIGYRAYIRQNWHSYNYDDWIWEGADSKCEIAGLRTYNKYCVVVRAFNEHAESQDSAGLCLILQSRGDDYDEDCDIDGIDLAAQARDMATIGLQNISSNFGLIGCHIQIFPEGDFGEDGDVDGEDLYDFFQLETIGVQNIASNFGLASWPTSISCEGDFNYDKDVDGTDLEKYIFDSNGLYLDEFASHFGRVNCP